MIIGFMGLLGLCVGSFLNVAIYRLPEGKSVLFPSSHCLTCKTPLRWYHNVPLLSWLFLRAKCATCKAPISIQYPLVELICAGLFIFVALREPLAEGVFLGLVFALLFALSLIDFRYKAVPDGLSFPALGIALLSGNVLVSLEHALMFAGGFALLRMSVSAFTKKEAMGEADILIAAIMGAILGITLGLVAIYLAALLALFTFYLLSKKEVALPFIPFLSLGLFLTYVFQTPITGLIEVYYG